MEFTVSRQVNLLLKLFAVLSLLSHMHMSYAAVPLLTANSIRKPCHGEVVTFTCTVFGVDLVWNPSDVNALSPINFQRPNATRGPYTAVLTHNTSTNVTSTLTTTARNGVTIDCVELGSGSRKTVTVLLAVPPSPPVNVIHSVQSSATDGAVVSVQWDPPDNNGGRDDLNYTVSISPSTTDLSATVVTSTTVTVTVDYNEDYTINIVATNCAGNSTVMEYMFRVDRECPMIMNPNNGVLGTAATNRSVGATVTLQCDPGFMSTGPMTATCMDTLMWVPDLGTFQCTPLPTTPPILCGLPQSPVNGSLGSHLTSSPLGTTVTFQCDDVRTSTCRDMSGMGEWEPNPADLVCRESTGQGTSAASTGVDVAISVVVTFIVSVLIGLTVGLLVMYLFMRDKVCKQNGPPSTASTNPPPPQEQPPPPGPVYEEVSTPKENIELETNLAYGPVGH